MMNELGWKPLNERRKEQRLVLLFKIVKNSRTASTLRRYRLFLFEFLVAMFEVPSDESKGGIGFITDFIDIC
jgi:hypothetical protein